MVGGAVRDLLLGLGRADLDIVVEGDAAALAARLGAEPREHERFATAKVEFDGHEVDIASARSESYPHPGSLPVVSPAAAIEADLGRRDFSVNAMAIPLAGEPRLIDPHGGRADLEAGLLRVLHRESFADDPTRAIRAARYAARLDLELEPETEALLRATDLDTVSADRRRAELLRLAGEATAPRGFALLREWGLLASRGGRTTWSRGSPTSPRRRPGPSAWRPADRARALLAAALGPAGRRARAGGRAPAAALARRSSWPAATTRSSWSWRAPSAPSGSTTTWRSGARSRSTIDGADLIAAGVPQGPALGRGLAAALRAKLDGEIASRDQELARGRSRPPPRRPLYGRLRPIACICLVRRMEWRESEGVRWLEADLGGARAAFATRVGGVSEAPFDRLNLGVLTDDSNEAVAENRERLAAALGLDPARIPIGLQVHGAELAFHSGPQQPSPFAVPGSEIPEVDGHVVSEPGLAPLVFTADCLPSPSPAPAAWRCCTAAGAASPPASSPPAPRRSAPPTPRSAPASAPAATKSAPRSSTPSPTSAPASPTGRWAEKSRWGRQIGPSAAGSGRGGAAAAGARLGLSGSRRLGSAPAVSRSCSSPTAATPAAPAARAGWSGSRPDGGADPRHRAGARCGPTWSGCASGPATGSRSSSPASTCRWRRWAPWPRRASTLVGENRQQDLAAKHERWGDAFEWDFIGNLQSRKVKQVLPLCRLVHSVATDSVLRELGKHGTPETEVLVEVNIAAEEGKGGVAPGDLAAFIERCPVRVGGLMTMPPFSQDPEASRPHFARLAELAAANGLSRLSMGTSQDWPVAVEEGATIIRLGTALFV